MLADPCHNSRTPVDFVDARRVSDERRQTVDRRTQAAAGQTSRNTATRGAQREAFPFRQAASVFLTAARDHQLALRLKF